MTEPQGKPEPTPRKRALVSCDRCKLRRARCIRSNPDEPCSDCKASGVPCESKLPRKQRVYGSVETLSLRFRALESLVKGLFPDENVGDTNTLFKIAATRNIPMPPADDFSPAEIFKDSEKQQSYQTPHPARSAEGQSPASSSLRQPNPFVEVQPPPPSEKLFPTFHGISLYFGASSSFKLAMTIRNLVSRCNAIPQARVLLRHSSSQPEFSTTQQGRAAASALQRASTGPSDEDYPIPESRASSHDRPRSQKRARTESDIDPTSASGKGPAQGIIEDFLPSRSVGDALVAAYLENLHPNFPLFQRSIFQLRYETMFSRTQELLRENNETGWLCCLALVFAFGAQVLENHDPEQARELQKKYLRFVRANFRRLITTTTLDNVQALVLLHLFDHNTGKRNNAYILLGTAVRMAMSMGLHREGPNAEFDPIERNNRKITWWTLYVFERTLSNILGRPSCIDDVEVSTKYEDDTMFENGAMAPEYRNYGFALVKLSYQIRIKAYHKEGTSQEQTPPVALAKDLLKQLDEWHAALPPHFRIDAPLPTAQKRGVLLLHIYYFYTRCVVSRDYLIRKIEGNISHLENREPPPSEDMDQALLLSEDCVNSAYQSLQLLSNTAELGQLNGVLCLDVFYVFHAVLVVCADFLARPEEQLESATDQDRKAAVRQILRSTRQIYLAPTYNILSQIAFQFASITGVTDETYPTQQIPGQPVHLSPTPQAASFGVHGSFVDVADTAQDWFENETANTSLDFFDMLMQTSSTPMPSDPAPDPEYLEDPATGEVEDWAARTLRGMHNTLR